MKQFFIICMMLIGSLAYTQENDLPGSINKAFTAKYQDAEIDDWEEQGDQFMIMFTELDYEKIAYFDKKGNWKMTKTSLSEDELPDKVSQTLSSNFSDADIKMIDFVEEKDKKDQYHIIVNNNSGEFKLYITPDGKLVSKNKLADYNIDNDFNEDTDDY